MTEPEERDGSPAPFLIAVALAVVVLIVVGVVALTRGERTPSEPGQVARAAVAQNDALQRQNYLDYQRNTCREAQRPEADVLAGQRDSQQRQGARYIEDVTNVKIDADRATATVTYHFANTPNDKRSSQLSFLRQDGSWTVCSDYK